MGEPAGKLPPRVAAGGFLERAVQREKGSRSANASSRVAGHQAQPRSNVKPEDKSQVQVIARAAAILRALEEEPAGLSLGQIAQRVALARSTVQRIVAAL